MENPHCGHRKRLEARAQQFGLEGLAPHEQVELLLFFAIPQGNVNPLAHRLIDRFGSLAGICHASQAELCAIPGIGKHTATLLTLLPQFARVYLTSAQAPCVRYDDVTRLGAMLVRRYIGVNTETVFLLLFGGKMNLLACDKLFEGSLTSSAITPRSVIERVFATNAAYVALAHNHPNGTAIPSGDDIDATRILAAALELADISLIEHILVGGQRYTPLMMKWNLSASLNTVCKLPTGFYAGLSNFDGGYLVNLQEDIA